MKARKNNHATRSTKEGLHVRIKAASTPQYKSAMAAGCDLCAAIDRKIVVRAGDFCTVPTGVRLEIPPGYEAQVRPRSGLAKQHGIGVLNAPGTIDSDYRGEIMVIIFNYGDKPFTIRNRDRIAQLVFSPVERAHFVRAKRLKRTARQGGGFGHTGV